MKFRAERGGRAERVCGGHGWVQLLTGANIASNRVKRMSMVDRVGSRKISSRTCCCRDSNAQSSELDHPLILLEAARETQHAICALTVELVHELELELHMYKEPQC